MFEHKKLQTNAQQTKHLKYFIYFCAREKRIAKVFHLFLEYDQKQRKRKLGYMREKI